MKGAVSRKGSREDAEKRVWALLLQKAREETAITNLVSARAAGSTVGVLSVNVSRSSTVVGMMGMGLDDVVGVCVFNPLWH